MSNKNDLYILGFSSILVIIFMAILTTSSVRDNALTEDSTGLAMAAQKNSVKWSTWYNTDGPNGAGDYETLSEIRKKNPNICETPIAVQCQTINGKAHTSTKQRVVCDVTTGLVCQNSLNNGSSKKVKCKDYKIRFACPITPQKCVDSDGGKNYTSKGKLSATTTRGVKTDYCTGGNTPNTLVEYYCSGSNDNITYYDCPNGCKDGACINDSIRCYRDSDCGTSIVNLPYCANNNTYCGPSYSAYTCENPGTINSGCVQRITNTACTPCDYGCNNRRCIEPYDTWSCRTVDNHLEMMPISPVSVYPKKLIVSKGQTMNYNTDFAVGDWNITILGGNDDDYSVIVRVNQDTRTMLLGSSKTMTNLIVILDKIEFSTDGNSVTATLYVLPQSFLGEERISTINTNKYCMNNNLYQKACPTIVDRNSEFVDKLIQTCTNGCYNNACSGVPINYFCNDTDYDNRYKAGTVKGFNANGQYTYSDRCINETTLTEYYCNGDTYASRQYLCEYNYEDPEMACDGSRCTPSLCNQSFFIENGNSVQINGRYGLQIFTVLGYNAETNSVHLGMNSTSGAWDDWVVDGDMITSNGQEFYVKDAFISNIGAPTAAIKLCFE